MEYFLHILVITGIYIILTLSLNLILGYTGLPAFGHAAFSCVGALYPKLNYDNAAEIPTSFGGALCMIFSIAFIGAAVMTEAWPIYPLAMEGFRHGRVQVPRICVFAPSLAALCARDPYRRHRAVKARFEAFGSIKRLAA